MQSNGYPGLDSKNAKAVGEAIQAHIDANSGSVASFDDSTFRSLIRLKKPQLVFDQQLLDSELALFQDTRASIKANSPGTSLADKRNLAEEAFAVTAVGLARTLPIEAIHDLDFWRYLSVFKLRDYVIATEGDFDPSRYGGDGDVGIIRWTLIRGLVWGLKTVSESDFSYIYKARLIAEEQDPVPKIRDFYISQIIRRATMKIPGAGRAYLDAAMQEPPLFDRGKGFRPTQHLGANILRVGANIYLPSLDEDQLFDLFMEQREGILSTPVVEDIGAREDT
jgi:hypothetical protein